MQKISTYLYPNRVELLADLASFNVEYTNVYQRIVKIYNGIDNTIEFDIKNADQKRIDLSTLSSIQLNVMDASGNELPNSPYIVESTALKGIATVTIPQEDLSNLSEQFLKYSVTAVKNGADVMLYVDSRFDAVGTIELVGNAMPKARDSRVYDSFTAEIDLKGVPTWHTSAIPSKFYEAVKTETLSFDISLRNLVGSIWIEGTKKGTINVEAFKGADYLWSTTYTPSIPGNGTVSVNNLNIGDYQYFRVSFTTPTINGIGASFLVDRNNETYTVTLRAGGTGYAVGSQIKVLGSLLGGTDGVNDLIITVASIDAATSTAVSSYTISSISTFTWAGTAASGVATNVVTGTNITGTVDRVIVN